MIEFDTIENLIDEAELDVNDVSRITITPSGVTFTLYVRMPSEDGELGKIMLHNGDVMVTQRVYSIHRPGDHVHEDDVVLDHTHDVTP